MHCVLPLHLIWMLCITFCRSVVGLQKSNQFVHAIIMYVSEISYLFWSCVMSGEYLTCETVCFFIWQFHPPPPPPNTHPFLIVVNQNMLVFMCCRSLKCRCSNCTKLSGICLRNLSFQMTQGTNNRSLKQALKINNKYLLLIVVSGQYEYRQHELYSVWCRPWKLTMEIEIILVSKSYFWVVFFKVMSHTKQLSNS